MELDRTERRILASLIEKRWTTPDQYPLSLNALVLACNQKSNRDPVYSLHEFEVEGALKALLLKELLLVREKEGGRVQRYGERLTERLALGRASAAVLAELLLRGPQTTPELLRRGRRMHPFEEVSQVEETMAHLREERLVRLQPKAPGQRHARWTHLLGVEDEPADTPEPAVSVEEAPRAEPAPAPVEAPATSGAEPDLAEEVAELRKEVAEIRRRLDRLEGSGSPPETPAT